MNKKTFLHKLQVERDKFELLLNRVGFTRTMTIKGVSGSWSIKDIVAHIWAYEQYIADRLNEIKHGDLYYPCKKFNALDAFIDQFGYPDFGSPLLDDEEANAWVYEKYKNVALEEIVAQEIQAYSSIVSAIESIPDYLIKEHNLFERVADNTYHHYHEHTKAIKAWLKKHSSKTKKI
jgi:hypothetical protein